MIRWRGCPVLRQLPAGARRARRTMEAATRRFPTNLESGLFVVPRPLL
ncbi:MULTISPECIES: hypothetical protein [unclassified Methanoculleus]|nr:MULTISPECIES: hypothetical protein [unclassified Methanoculleus]MCK9316908.1 hypothetical protein [Methanoculleus sp.]MDD2253311.1 hypothetical protein [Methanoculleus sp.]MDD2788173.1 hypothetical protein [Methanoculleus sp.]MDD3215111.1 hypothetical protein [Methanoculleus sp.]MDD4313125.1 hypothetical protein [Methanoculleus sp.]